MLGHQASLNKFKEIEIMSSVVFFPQSKWYNTKNQQQEENWKVYEHMEIKQHIPEEPMGE